MKKLFLIIISIVFLSSCEEKDKYVFFGTNETEKKISCFITENMGAANNMADEEMEDVIEQLYQVAVRTFCTFKPEGEKKPNERIFKRY